ncbi:MAG: C45 family peptidase [Myxococcota bacterium]
MLRIIHLAGPPKAMGEAFGEAHRAEIQEFYRLRVLNALSQAAQYGGRKLGESHLLAVAQKSLSVSESYDPAGFQELNGIARGANLSVEQAFAMNGLTDLRDVLAWSKEVPGFEGCSSFLIQGDKTKDGRILAGQTWDLATDNMPYVIGVHRRPKDGPETWCLSTVGCLSLIGLNAEGIAIGTTNIRTKDARPGICYLSVIHKVLSTRRMEDAIDAVRTKGRAAAHYYWLASRDRRTVGVECTAAQEDLVEVERGHYVHCNHVLLTVNQALESAPPKPSESTVCRQNRLSELIGSAPPGSIDAGTMRRFLSDHEGGEGAICRHDLAGISSNGAVIVSVEEGKIIACQGLPCTAEWVDLVSGNRAPA